MAALLSCRSELRKVELFPLVVVVVAAAAAAAAAIGAVMTKLKRKAPVVHGQKRRLVFQVPGSSGGCTILMRCG